MSNTYNKKEVEEGLDQPSAGKRRRKRFSLNESLRDGSMARQIPFILLITAFGLVLVLNRYGVESLLRQKKQLQEQIDVLKEDGVQRQKTYQQMVRISNIASVLDSSGVQIISGPPYEIKR